MTEEEREILIKKIAEQFARYFSGESLKDIWATQQIGDQCRVQADLTRSTRLMLGDYD